jgi:hypothetical protein
MLLQLLEHFYFIRVILGKKVENTFVLTTKGVLIMNKKNSNETQEIAGRIYDASDYQKSDQLSSGLATTHEQVSDTYMEGEIGCVMDDVNGKDIPLQNDDQE